MLGIGVQELLLILFIVLILFGAKRVPEVAKGLGKALKEFRNAAKDIGVDDNQPENIRHDNDKSGEPPYKA